MPNIKITRQGPSRPIQYSQGYDGQDASGIQVEGKGDAWFNLLGKYSYSQLHGATVDVEVLEPKVLRLLGNPPPVPAKPASPGGGGGYRGAAPVAKPWAELERVFGAACALMDEHNVGEDATGRSTTLNTILMGFLRGDVLPPTDPNTPHSGQGSPSANVQAEASLSEAAEMFGAPAPTDADAPGDSGIPFADMTQDSNPNRRFRS
jgi:hypothetical protein